MNENNIVADSIWEKPIVVVPSGEKPAKEYRDYCKQVCSVLKKATPKEKTSLSEELLDHMESHAEVLIELGWDPEEARAYSIQAMGDPETVGRQYDEKLSVCWLWFGYVARAVLIILIVWILMFPVWVKGIMIYENIQARLESARYFISANWGEDTSSLQPMEVNLSLKHDVLHLYCNRLNYREGGNPHLVTIYGMTYAKNPLRELGPWLGLIEFEGFRNGGSRLSNASASTTWRGYVQMGQEYVVMTIKRESTGTDIRVEIPLQWEGLP